jgi:hypothetical protein
MSAPPNLKQQQFLSLLMASKAAVHSLILYPRNGNEIAWIISQLFAVVQNAAANGVFFNSPTG